MSRTKGSKNRFPRKPVSDEVRNKIRIAKIKHNESAFGETPSKEYKIWSSMKSKCYDKNNRQYKLYGGKGIRVCDEWRYSYETFLKDMGRRPRDKQVLGRIDHNGDYNKENCVWITYREKGVTNPRAILFKGITLRQASRNLGMSAYAISLRIKHGWSIEKAFTTPKISHSVGGRMNMISPSERLKMVT